MFENLLNIIKNKMMIKYLYMIIMKKTVKNLNYLISDYINKGFVLIINYRGKLKIQTEAIMKTKINIIG